MKIFCTVNRIYYVYDLLFVYRFVVFYGVFFLEHKKTPKNFDTQQINCNVPWWLAGSPWNDLIVNMWTCLFTETFYLDKYCFNLQRLNYYIILFICSLTIMISLGHRLESILISQPQPYPLSIIDKSVKVKSNATLCQETTKPYRKVFVTCSGRWPLQQVTYAAKPSLFVGLESRVKIPSSTMMMPQTDKNKNQIGQ